MIKLMTNWFKQYFADPEVSVLWLFLLFIFLMLFFFGNMLIPVFVSIAIAYILQWFIARLEQIRIPHVIAVATVYCAFLGLVIFAVLGLLPLLWRQLSNLVNELPGMVGKGQMILLNLPARYPGYISTGQINQLMMDSKTYLAHFGQIILSASFSSIPTLIAVVVYLVLVPLLVYFFLMDRRQIVDWLDVRLPKRRRLIREVWQDVYAQIGNYVRGKVLEMVIVWVVSYIAFILMGLQYAMLLSALIGVSVIIPYIGAVVVTVPVVVIAFLQWGLTPHFYYLLLVYAIIIILDGNVLVPLLFSEAVNLHPVAIIIAVLVFGGLFGFWGVFFAIPLATLVRAIMNVLPVHTEIKISSLRRKRVR